MKKIKYEVYGDFGLLNEGTIIDAYLVSQDNDTGNALIYHAKDKYSCASVDICIFNKKTNCFRAIHPDAYINIDGKDIFKSLIQRKKK